ncbi:uncharacterized protein LOC144633926 [Oculina patagonica]
MAGKVSFIVAVSLLCGFLAVIPPGYSISCLHKTTYKDYLVIDDETVDCEGDYDKCGILAFTLDTSSNIVVANCTRSTVDCDEAVACERARAIFETRGYTFTDCSQSCCDSDYCNAPAEKRTAMGLDILQKEN